MQRVLVGAGNLLLAAIAGEVCALATGKVGARSAGGQRTLLTPTDRRSAKLRDTRRCRTQRSSSTEHAAPLGLKALAKYLAGSIEASTGPPECLCLAALASLKSLATFPGMLARAKWSSSSVSCPKVAQQLFKSCFGIGCSLGLARARPSWTGVCPGGLMGTTLSRPPAAHVERARLLRTRSFGSGELAQIRTILAGLGHPLAKVGQNLTQLEHSWPIGCQFGSGSTRFWAKLENHGQTMAQTGQNRPNWGPNLRSRSNVWTTVGQKLGICRARRVGTGSLSGVVPWGRAPMSQHPIPASSSTTCYAFRLAVFGCCRRPLPRSSGSLPACQSLQSKGLGKASRGGVGTSRRCGSPAQNRRPPPKCPEGCGSQSAGVGGLERSVVRRQPSGNITLSAIPGRAGVPPPTASGSTCAPGVSDPERGRMTCDDASGQARRRPRPFIFSRRRPVQKGLGLYRHSSPSHAHRLKGKERGSSL